MKIKKEKMQAAKTFTLFISALLIIGCATSIPVQNNLTGIFSPKSTPVGIGHTYRFDGSIFVEKVYEHMEITTVFNGSYNITGDTLTLNYKPMEDPDPSVYSFSRRKKITAPTQNAGKGTVTFKVADKSGTPLFRTRLFLRNQSEEKIKSLPADSLGYFPEISLSNENIHDFRLAYLGRKSVVVPADTLEGYHSEVKVVLSDSTTYYSDYNGTKKYLIKEAKPNRIILQPVGADKPDRMVLVREGTEE